MSASYYFILLVCLVSPSILARVITSDDDLSLNGSKRIDFDDLPVAYIVDSFNDGVSIDGVSFSETSLSIAGVTFFNGGDTVYFAAGETPSSSARTIELDGIAIRREGEQFGLTPPSSSSNHVLQQKTEDRSPFLDSPGRLNTIQIEFEPPVQAFGLIVGGNQPQDNLEVYDTENTQIAVIRRDSGAPVLTTAYMGDFYIGYSAEGAGENKIAYIKYGNRNSHDAIWMDELSYSQGLLVPEGPWWNRWRWIPPWLPLFFILSGLAIYLITRSLSLRKGK